MKRDCYESHLQEHGVDFNDSRSIYDVCVQPCSVHCFVVDVLVVSLYDILITIFDTDSSYSVSQWDCFNIYYL